MSTHDAVKMYLLRLMWCTWCTCNGSTSRTPLVYVALFTSRQNSHVELFYQRPIQFDRGEAPLPFWLSEALRVARVGNTEPAGARFAIRFCLTKNRHTRLQEIGYVLRLNIQALG